MRFLAPLLLACLLALPAAAQRILISGQVVEAANGEPVPFASIFVPRSNFGVTADMEGKFKLTLTGSPDSLAVSAIGFATQRRKLGDAATQTVLFRMKTGGVALGEVFVSSRQPENPAFRILREVQRHKPENQRIALKAAEYDSYNRIETSLIDLPASLSKRRAIRDIRALAVRQGAAAVGDHDAPLPVFASEVGSRVYQRNAPLRRREDLLHKQLRGVGPREGSVLSQMLGSNFQNFDFYPSWQNVLGKDFISPIAEGGRGTYDYELQDSVFVGQDFCYKIAVTPKRSHDLAFKGTIWVTQQGYALRRLDLVASPEANINFVDDLRVTQELTPPADGPGLPTRTKLLISVRPSAKQAAMLVRYTTVSSNFVRNKVHSEPGFYDQPVVSSMMEPTVQSPTGGLPAGGASSYFDTHRPDTLTLSERQTFAVLDSAKALPSVRNLLDWVDLLVNGYKRVGKLDFGPISTIYARNDFEGSRFRFGFRTTPLISHDWVTQAYVAYGTQDGRFKYGVRESYIAERRHWTVISGEFRHDVEQAALLDNDFLDNNNNLFVAASRWGRFQQGRPVLRDLAALSVQRDLFHGFTQTLTARYQNIAPLFELRLHNEPRPPGVPMPADEPASNVLNLNELVIASRYAPDEALVQNENRRQVVGLRRWPVFGLRYTLGAIDWTRGKFMYHKFNLSVSHSVSVGYFGRLNYRAESNYIPTALPYFILKTPLGNQTPFYNGNAFNLMNYFEFITDRSVSLRLDQHFEGLLLNAIPGIRTLNWRLVGTTNILYGALSGQARRANNNSEDLPGSISQPYIEAGYGIENIFKFLRVDFIHRLTYRDAPGTSNFGVKFGAQFRL